MRCPNDARPFENHRGDSLLTRQRVIATLLAAFLILGLAAPSHAKRYNHPSGFSFSIPSSWNVKTQTDLITGSTKDNAAAASFSVPAAGVNVNLLASVADKEMRKQLKNVRTDKPIHSTVNGLKVTLVDGVGTMSGQTMMFTYGVYSSGNRSIVCVLLCLKSKFAVHKDEMVKILQSVKG